MSSAKPSNVTKPRTSKRKRASPSSPDTSTQRTKQLKPYKPPPKEMEELKELIINVSKQVADSQNSVENKISSLSAKIDTEINTITTQFNSFAANVNSEIVSIESQLKVQSDRITYTEDDIKRITMMNQLRILGFASSTNENLKCLFDSIAAEIGYVVQSDNEIPTITRIPMINKQTGAVTGSGTILFEFVANQFKTKFYSLYLHKAPLKADKFGLPTSSNIVIGENLTKRNAELFAIAKSLKRDNKVAQTFTENGLVHVKLKKGRSEQAILIRSKRQLEMLAAGESNFMDCTPPDANDTQAQLQQKRQQEEQQQSTAINPAQTV